MRITDSAKTERISRLDVRLDTNRRRHIRLKYELELVDSSISDIARSLGVSHSTVQAVTTGRGVSARVMKAISEKIQVPETEIWPEHNSEDKGDSN